MSIKIFRFFMLIIISAFVLKSCTPINYIGKVYPSTEEIQTYYSFDEVLGEYTVFGHIISGYSTNNILISTNEYIENLEEEAMKRGADALVITELDIQSGDDGEKEKIKASLVKYLE